MISLRTILRFKPSHQNRSLTLSSAQKEKFSREGFLIIPNFLSLPSSSYDLLNSRLEGLFSGKFETGVYPDEWNWREGMSFPHLTREICNAWKSDRMMASISLSKEIGKIISELGNWEGTRIAQDDVWMKPPGGKEVAFHRDIEYFDFLDPLDVITCWIALEDTTGRGPLEYIPGSHLWEEKEKKLRKGKNQSSEEYRQERQPFFTSNDYLRDMISAAERAEIPESERQIVKVDLPAGGVAFHHMGLWHGSGKNTHPSLFRKAIALHAIPCNTHFRPTGVHYTYGRYKRYQDQTMDENFFPILYRKDGYRTPFLKEYVRFELQLAK